MVLNVGIGRGVGLKGTTPEQWDETVATNLRSHFLACRVALALMADHSSIVFVGSVAGIRPGSRIPAYDASKAAVAALCRHVPAEGAAGRAGQRRRARPNRHTARQASNRRATDPSADAGGTRSAGNRMGGRRSSGVVALRTSELRDRPGARRRRWPEHALIQRDPQNVRVVRRSQLGERLVQLTFESRQLSRPVAVRVLLRSRCDRGALRRYPVAASFSGVLDTNDPQCTRWSAGRRRSTAGHATRSSAHATSTKRSGVSTIPGTWRQLARPPPRPLQRRRPDGVLGRSRRRTEHDTEPRDRSHGSRGLRDERLVPRATRRTGHRPHVARRPRTPPLGLLEQ